MCGHGSRARSRVRCRIGHAACRLGIFFLILPSTHARIHVHTHCHEFYIESLSGTRKR